ncbi:uncharacterized protein L201_006959 [Kwoniella dendrophila CBS 6074]|uniref:BRCT domain-containing protein n=1 Tax=Kwoniella dendrophila CBS 6074 TaxID=1295534 RepID=A0AAX4K311_9TREE
MVFYVHDAKTNYMGEGRLEMVAKDGILENGGSIINSPSDDKVTHILVPPDKEYKRIDSNYSSIVNIFDDSLKTVYHHISNDQLTLIKDWNIPKLVVYFDQHLDRNNEVIEERFNQSVIRKLDNVDSSTSTVKGEEGIARNEYRQRIIKPILRFDWILECLEVGELLGEERDWAGHLIRGRVISPSNPYLSNPMAIQPIEMGGQGKSQEHLDFARSLSSGSAMRSHPPIPTLSGSSKAYQPRSKEFYLPLTKMQYVRLNKAPLVLRDDLQPNSIKPIAQLNSPSAQILRDKRNEIPDLTKKVNRWTNLAKAEKSPSAVLAELKEPKKVKFVDVEPKCISVTAEREPVGTIHTLYQSQTSQPRRGVQQTHEAGDAKVALSREEPKPIQTRKQIEAHYTPYTPIKPRTSASLVAKPEISKKRISPSVPGDPRHAAKRLKVDISTGKVDSSSRVSVADEKSQAKLERKPILPLSHPDIKPALASKSNSNTSPIKAGNDLQAVNDDKSRKSSIVTNNTCPGTLSLGQVNKVFLDRGRHMTFHVHENHFTTEFCIKTSGGILIPIEYAQTIIFPRHGSPNSRVTLNEVESSIMDQV